MLNNSLQYLAQLASLRRQQPSITPKDLAEVVKLRGLASNAESDQNKALERLRGFTAQTQDIAGQESQVYTDAASRSYKQPERQELKGGDFTTALVIGALEALVGKKGAGQDTANIL